MKPYEYWKPPRQIERKYQRSLNTITNMIQQITEATNDPYKMLIGLQRLSRDRHFQKHCDNLAMNMTTQLYKFNNKGWRQAAAQASKGKTIYDAILNDIRSGKLNWCLNEQIANNAALIKTMPIELATEYQLKIDELSRTGLRASDIAAEFRHRLPDKSKANLNTIGRTSISQTQTSFIQARAEYLDLLPWYIWRTTKDSRVRGSHDIMDGVLVCWNNPPCPELLDKSFKGKTYGNYHAGCIFNCRCYPEPVVDINMITFPCKVYYNERIQYMTKAEFLKIA